MMDQKNEQLMQWKHCIHKYNNMIVNELCNIEYNFILYHDFDQRMACQAPEKHERERQTKC